MSTMPPWFKGIVYVEVFLQVPFFLAAIVAWLRRSNWIRIPTIIYGAHTATTLVPSEWSCNCRLLCMVGCQGMWASAKGGRPIRP